MPISAFSGVGPARPTRHASLWPGPTEDLVIIIIVTLASWVLVFGIAAMVLFR
jgi:hypothetical protein